MSKKRINFKQKQFVTSVDKSIALVSCTESHISFSYEFFQHGTCGGESFIDWENERWLSKLNEKLIEYSKKTRNELITQEIMKDYGDFPLESKFICPEALKIQSARWCAIRLDGKRRLCGVFLNKESKKRDVFFITYLDKNHQFYPSKKKHT